MKEKQRCPHCGQVISIREIALYRGLIGALYRVFSWAKARGGDYRFTRKGIKHLLRNENDTARFGDLVMFGGLVFKEGKAHYGLNFERCEAFFRGQYKIPMRILKDPITGNLTPEEYKTINEIPGITKFLDGEGTYVPEYRPRPANDLFFKEKKA